MLLKYLEATRRQRECNKHMRRASVEDYYIVDDSS